jgi:hypothetical protein
MSTAHATRLAKSIEFKDWAREIQRATDLDELVHVVRAYLACWSPDQLRGLPLDVGANALAESEDIVARAVIASQAELKYSGKPEDYALLREMALTFVAAACRLRYLKGLGGRL